MSPGTQRAPAPAVLTAPARGADVLTRMAAQFAAHDEMCRVLRAEAFPILWQLVDVMSLRPDPNHRAR
jgi:hypothetical protein